MYDPDTHAVKAGTFLTLTLPVPVPEGRKEAKDYEKLDNKPQINGVTLTGNKLLADLFPDGIIIDGGDSNGFPNEAEGVTP